MLLFKQRLHLIPFDPKIMFETKVKSDPKIRFSTKIKFGPKISFILKIFMHSKFCIDSGYFYL